MKRHWKSFFLKNCYYDDEKQSWKLRRMKKNFSYRNYFSWNASKHFFLSIFILFYFFPTQTPFKIPKAKSILFLFFCVFFPLEYLTSMHFRMNKLFFSMFCCYWIRFFTLFLFNEKFSGFFKSFMFPFLLNLILLKVVSVQLWAIENFKKNSVAI